MIQDPDSMVIRGNTATGLSVAANKSKVFGHNQRTCTYSIGDVSPDNRLTTILLAGNAFGTMLTELRLRGLATTSEDMLTAKNEE